MLRVFFFSSTDYSLLFIYLIFPIKLYITWKQNLFLYHYIPGIGCAHGRCLQVCLVNITNIHFQIVHTLGEIEAMSNDSRALCFLCLDMIASYVVVSLVNNMIFKKKYGYSYRPKVYLMAKLDFHGWLRKAWDNTGIRQRYGSHSLPKFPIGNSYFIVHRRGGRGSLDGCMISLCSVACLLSCSLECCQLKQGNKFYQMMKHR